MKTEKDREGEGDKTRGEKERGGKGVRERL